MIIWIAQKQTSCLAARGMLNATSKCGLLNSLASSTEKTCKPWATMPWLPARVTGMLIIPWLTSILLYSVHPEQLSLHPRNEKNFLFSVILGICPNFAYKTSSSFPFFNSRKTWRRLNLSWDRCTMTSSIKSQNKLLNVEMMCPGVSFNL